jgi:hypothetical protein
MGGNRWRKIEDLQGDDTSSSRCQKLKFALSRPLNSSHYDPKPLRVLFPRFIYAIPVQGETDIELLSRI